MDLDLFIRNESLSEKAKTNLRLLRNSGVSILNVINFLLENLNIDSFI